MFRIRACAVGGVRILELNLTSVSFILLDSGLYVLNQATKSMCCSSLEEAVGGKLPEHSLVKDGRTQKTQGIKWLKEDKHAVCFITCQEND